MLSGLRRRFPVLANLYVGQVVFGALAALLVRALYVHYAGTAPLEDLALAGRWAGAVILALAFGIYLQNIHRFGLIPDYSLKCRYCNGPVNRYSEFCEHCGGDLIAEEKLIPCPKCGIELYEGTKHCPECGGRVTVDKRKSKKGGGKRAAREAEADAGTASVGWSTPVDAISGFPPEERR